MVSEYTTVRERANGLVSFHDCPADIRLYRVASGYDPIVGDFVDISGGEVSRSSNNPTTRPFGLTVGITPDPEVYPAFAGHYDGYVLVGTLSPATELRLPFLYVGSTDVNIDGETISQYEYLPANQIGRLTHLLGSDLGLYWDSGSRRWGIGVEWDSTNQRWVSPTGANGRVRLQGVNAIPSHSNPVADGEGDYAIAVALVL